jgi:hypothetical protein
MGTTVNLSKKLSGEFMMGYILSNKLIFLIFVLGLLTQSCADLTIKYSITQANWTNLATPYNFSVKVWKDNTKDNPIVKKTTYAKFIIWVENESSGYKIYTNATTINGYKSIKYKAELFNASGEHPSGVGSNPTEAWGSETGGLIYWTPIKADDFGGHSSTKTPIPLGALILTLIAIPLLTLKMVRK